MTNKDQPTKLVRPKPLAQRLGIGVSTLWDWVSRGKFVQPIRLGPRTTVFRESDVEAWLDSKTHHSTSDPGAEAAA